MSANCEYPAVPGTSASTDGRMRFVIVLKSNGAMRFELLKAIASGL